MLKKAKAKTAGQRARTQTSAGRRRFLKTAALTAGAAATTGLIDGFPLVWSQNIKDVKLMHVGGSYSADRKSTRLNSSHTVISYAVFCLKKKKKRDNNCRHVTVTSCVHRMSHDQDRV